MIKNSKTKKITRLIARPLGLDLKFWKASDAEKNLSFELQDTPIILSVDRADYTKGIMQRLEMIDYFFGTNPQYRLNMPTPMRHSRLKLIKQRLKTNSLEKWWHDFKLTG